MLSMDDKRKKSRRKLVRLKRRKNMEARMNRRLEKSSLDKKRKKTSEWDSDVEGEIPIEACPTKKVRN